MLDDYMGAVSGLWNFFVREPVFPLLSIIVLIALVCAIQRNRIGNLTEALAAAEYQNTSTLQALGATSAGHALVRIGELNARVETLLVIGEGTNELQRIIIAKQLIERNRI